MIYYSGKDDLNIPDDELVRLCDDKKSGTWDEDCEKKINGILKAATDMINSYAVKKYKVPFDPTPGTIKDAAIIIARYKLYATRSSATKQMRQDFEDQKEFLIKLSENKVGILEIDSQNEDQENIVKPKARIFSNRKRTDRKFFDGIPGY